MDTLYTFWDNTTHYKTKSVDFLGLMTSATKKNLDKTPTNLFTTVYSKAHKVGNRIKAK